MRLPTLNPTLFPCVPPIFPTVGAHAPYMVLSNHGGWADDMGKGEIGGTGRQIPGSTPQLSVGCLDLHHGVARTRESITILTCHRHEHKISQGLSACRTSCVCQLDYFAQWPRLPGMIPPGSFMRLREGNINQDTGFQRKREIFHLERRQWRLWKCWTVHTVLGITKSNAICN